MPSFGRYLNPTEKNSTQNLQLSVDENLRTHDENWRMLKAAKAIQRTFRGHVVRKSFLPISLYGKYKDLVSAALLPDSIMPKADAGTTPVYLPKELPEVVLKRSGREEAIERFEIMQEIRKILASQKSTHLTIPRAALFDDFLIEERLPISSDEYINMGTYLSEPRLFDDAVRELVRMFSKIALTDLVGRQTDIPLSCATDECIRYDNLPLYVVEKKGKKTGIIGLIDLEHNTEPDEEENFTILATIFPLHVDVILDEAKKLGLLGRFNGRFSGIPQKVKEAQTKAMKYFENGYLNHLKWLEEKGINCGNTTEAFHVPPKRRKQLKNIVLNDLLRINQGTYTLYEERIFGIMDGKIVTQKSAPVVNHSDPLTGFINGCDSNKLAKKICRLLIKNLEKCINDHLNTQLRTIKLPMTNHEMIRLRSVDLNRSEIFAGITDCIKNVCNRPERPNMEIIVSEQLAYGFVQELINGNDLCSLFEAVKKGWTIKI